MAGSAITGTPNISGAPTSYPGGSLALSPAIQTIWSKEILFQAMPILRFEQFAVKKTELGVTPGLTINFMRYNNLGQASQLVEGIRMQTNPLTASQFSITVAEQGFAVAVSELLLNASFDDVMASASRLLGRNMATYLDISARNTLLQASSQLFGYQKDTGAINNQVYYNTGTVGTSNASMTGDFNLTSQVVFDAVETLATKNVPRLGETYVCFVHPHQSRWLRNDPQFIEQTKYAAPGNFMLGEIGRLNDVVFIETTQVRNVVGGAGTGWTTDTTTNGITTGNGTANRYDSIFIGDNAFGHAISLPVELRDGGILDFGREHALAWYAIWGLGLITDISVVVASTN
jgi:N4-gp56 family major capsid protein